MEKKEIIRDLLIILCFFVLFIPEVLLRFCLILAGHGFTDTVASHRMQMAKKKDALFQFYLVPEFFPEP
jgi:hypothetical protein